MPECDSHYGNRVISTSAPRQRLFIVTGKGGVGKTLISTALAAAFARRGERTLLVRHSSRDVPHPLLSITQRYTPSQAQPHLFASRVDGQGAMREYMQRTMWLPGVYEWFLSGPALVHFTEAAPGFEELMCLGKLYDLATDRSANRFERIVFDASASGHVALMLRTPRVTISAVRSGPLHHNAVKIQGLLENDLATSVLIVALAEEMAVREAIELERRLRGEDRLHVGPTIVNRLLPLCFADEEVKGLAALQTVSPSLANLRAAATAYHDVGLAQTRNVASLRQAGLRVLPVNERILPAFDASALIDGVAASLAPLLDGTIRV